MRTPPCLDPTLSGTWTLYLTSDTKMLKTAGGRLCFSKKEEGGILRTRILSEYYKKHSFFVVETKRLAGETPSRRFEHWDILETGEDRRRTNSLQ